MLGHHRFKIEKKKKLLTETTNTKERKKVVGTGWRRRGKVGRKDRVRRSKEGEAGGAHASKRSRWLLGCSQP